MRRIMIKRDLSQLTIWIDRTLHDWFKSHAKSRGMSMSEIVQNHLVELRAREEAGLAEEKEG